MSPRQILIALFLAQMWRRTVTRHFLFCIQIKKRQKTNKESDYID